MLEPEGRGSTDKADRAPLQSGHLPLPPVSARRQGSRGESLGAGPEAAAKVGLERRTRCPTRSAAPPAVALRSEPATSVRGSAGAPGGRGLPPSGRAERRAARHTAGTPKCSPCPCGAAAGSLSEAPSCRRGSSDCPLGFRTGSAPAQAQLPQPETAARGGGRVPRSESAPCAAGGWRGPARPVGPPVAADSFPIGAVGWAPAGHACL